MPLQNLFPLVANEGEQRKLPQRLTHLSCLLISYLSCLIFRLSATIFSTFSTQGYVQGAKHRWFAVKR